MDTKQLNIERCEAQRQKKEKVRCRGFSNGRPFGQQPKDDMEDMVYGGNEIGMRSRKFVDHSKNPIRRKFMTDAWAVHRIRFCWMCAECFLDTTPYNRSKFEQQRRKNKRITKDMLIF
jgi:hypothetical protein